MASPSRSLYSDDDYSARYDSDDFASDDDIVSIRQTDSKPPPTKASPYTIPNKGRGRGRGRGQAGSKPGSKHSTPQPANTVVKRMLSASRIRMNGYRNQIEELNLRIQELTDENKTLKKMQFRHQKALGKFEEQESELPLLLTKHANEVRTLREQNRKTKEKYHQTERYLRDCEDELEGNKAQLKKYKKICNQKGLKERDELHRSVQQSEIWLEEKDSRIKELERHIEALNKNHRHEMGIELAHHRETKKQFKLLEEKKSDAVLALREKEKELEIKNIYSNRLMKASPKHHSSYNGTPLHTPPPGRKKRVPSLTDLTSKDKVKLYEEKRKIEEKKKSPRHKPRDIWSEKEKVSKEPLKTKQDDSKVNKRIDSEEDADLWIQREHNRIKLEKEEQDKRKLLEEERMKKNEKEERQWREEEEKEKRLREEQERESNWREEMEREKRERKRKEDEKEDLARQERLDREKREEEERRNRERKEEERRKRLEEEEKWLREQAKLREKEAEEERRRLEIDPKLQEERRKKDLLLAKLKQMDNSEKLPEPVSMKAESPQRATFITSNPSYSPGLDSNYSTKSNYSFTKPTENLHNGFPAHDDVTVPYIEKQRKVQSRKEDQEVGGYQPSFTSSVFNSDNLKAPPTNNKAKISKNNDIQRTTIPASSDRKAKLLNDLFGKKSEEKNSNEDFGVTEKVRKSSGTKTSSFPWDNGESKSVNNNSATNRENSSTLFGGGSALIEFDDGFENGAAKLLPKRPHHSTTTFSSKPAVNAIDNLEDDIEEVML